MPCAIDDVALVKRHFRLAVQNVRIAAADPR
jgi:hypothetical protein